MFDILEIINKINNFTNTPIYSFYFWSIIFILFVVSFGLQLYNDKLCNLVGEIIRIVHHYFLFIIYLGWTAPQSYLIYIFIINLIVFLLWIINNNICIFTTIENNICNLPKNRRFHDIFYYFSLFNLEKFNLKYRINILAVILLFILLRLYVNYISNINKHNFSIIAHRGGSKECGCPDNSIDSFNYSLRSNVDVLEMDTNVTKDKKLILYHDTHINNILCKNLTLQQIQEINPNIITLEELLDFINMTNYSNKNTIKFSIEIKTQNNTETDEEVFESVELLLDAINKYNIGYKTIIQSFDKRVITCVQSIAPNVELSFLIEDPNINIVDIGKELKVHIISPEYKLLNPNIVLQLHENNIKVVPWTVNTEYDLQTMLDMCVDGIITDYPNKFNNYIQNLNK